MASFSIPLTGLDADATALNTIANDLANMGTTAYKSQNATFSDLFYQQIGNTGSGDPMVSGLGTQIGSIETDYSQGSLETTDNASDMALDGGGFFMVQGAAGQQYLTRAGNFSVDASGNLMTTNGLQVMGYPAVSGVVNPDAALSPMNIPEASSEPPSATQNVSMTANLDASAAPGTVVNATVQVYDSLGTAHTVTLACTKSSTANTWTYSASLPSGDAGKTSGATGTLTFADNGNLTSPSGPISGINFSGMADGAANMSLSLNFFGKGGASTLTQRAAASQVTSTTQDGYPSGQFESFAVGTDGTVQALFDNGHTVTLGQVAVGQVANSAGLQAIGGNLYEATPASGTVSVGQAGTGSRGAIEDGALEQSNVNISEEFANLISAQRAFEANSKSVTTFDTIAQDTINMVH